MGVFLIASCNKEDKNAEAKDALKALRKIEAATQVGVNYQQYRLLVIDAQAAVNEAGEKLPDGELKRHLFTVMLLYAKVGEAWGRRIENSGIRDAEDEELNVQLEEVRSNAWLVASKGIKRIAELIEQ